MLASNLVGKALSGRQANLADSGFAPWIMVANVLLNLDETFTRE